MEYGQFFLIFNRIFLVIIIGLTLWLAFWVYSADTKEKTNRVFLLMAISFLFWWAGGYLFSFTNNLNFALWFGRTLLSVVSLSFCALYYFVTIFPYEKRNRLIDRVMFGSTIVFFILPLLGNIIVSGMKFTPHGNDPIFGRFQVLYYAWIALAIIITSITLIKKYFQTERAILRKIQYLMFGFLFFLGMNLIFNVILPVVRGSIEFWQFGNYSAVVLLGFTAYAIVRQKLFGIKIVLTTIIVAMISLVLATDLFVLTQELWLRLLKAIVLVLFVWLGRWLITAVLLEIKERQEIQKLANDLEKANNHLEEMDKLKDDFLSMASHELNTPIAAIEGYLSMILDEGMGGKIPDKARDYLKSVYSSSQRLAHLVKDLLDVSRIESKRIHLIYEEKQLEELVEQAIKEIAPKVKEAKHTLVFNQPKQPLPKTWLDTTRITEILINILGNAIKYTDSGGKIEIKLFKDESKIVVAVKDNGKGIPKDKQDRVFQKFSQVDVLKDEVKGTGLGMYISKKFIELHKGKIWFTSEGAGKGTTFFFSLPILAKKPYDPYENEGPVLH